MFVILGALAMFGSGPSLLEVVTDLLVPSCHGSLLVPAARASSCQGFKDPHDNIDRSWCFYAGRQLWELHALASSHREEKVRRAAKAVAAIPTDSMPQSP